MAPRIVIAGGGISGVVAADELKSKLKDTASVILIERKPRFSFPPSFPWVAMGAREPGQIQVDFAPLERRGIQMVREEIVGFDLPARTVRTSGSQVPFDHLIIALGAEYAPDAVPGLAAHAHHMYDLDSAVRLRGAIERFKDGRIAVGVARLPFKCPAAPYEISMLLDDAFRRRNIREKVTIDLFTPEGAPLPAAGPENGAKVLAMLRDRGVTYHPKRMLKEVKPGSLTFQDGEPLPFDLLVCVPPHRAPSPVLDAGLADTSGWIPVNSASFQTNQPDVYAIGDVAAVPTPNGYVPVLPKAGVFAVGQAKLVAHNLALKIRGRRGRPMEWDGYGACFLETARGKSAFMSGNFLASPRPILHLRSPNSIYHTQKVLYEKYWMRHWF